MSISLFQNLVYIYKLKHKMVKHTFSITNSNQHPTREMRYNTLYTALATKQRCQQRILCRPVQIFNKLPTEIKNLELLNSFKVEVKRYLAIRGNTNYLLNC